MTTTTENKTYWGIPDATQLLTVDATRDEWLAARRNGLGGSEISVTTRTNTYQTPWQLWMEKTNPEPPVEEEDNDLFWFGHAAEPLLAEKFTTETGVPTRRVGMYQNKKHAWAFANPDRLTGDGGILEIKTTSGFTDNGKAYLDNRIPQPHLEQLTWYMWVTGRHTGWVIALVDKKPIILQVDYNPDLATRLVESGTEFWEYVTTNTPPPPVPGFMTDDELRERYPDDDGESVEAEISFVTAHDVEELKKINEQIKTATEDKKAIEARLKTQIGEHKTLTIDGEPVARWATVKGRKSFDKESALTTIARYKGIDVSTKPALAELEDEFTKTGNPSRRFTLV